MSQQSGNRQNHFRRRQQHEGKQEETERQEMEVDLSSPIIQDFMVFQKELDAKHDKYERLVKHGRDLTIESKRVIFLLHRMKGNDDDARILTESEKRLKDLEKVLLKRIVKELINEDTYQYLRSFSPGIQEFIEAVTFYFYEKEKQLIPLNMIINELEENILEGENEDVLVEMRKQARQLIQPSDYILGIADLTGELMRKCIMAIGAGQMEMPFELCRFLRQVHDGFLSIGNQGPREVTRKLLTLKQSLNKVETACYTLQVRGSELPKHMLVDVFTRDQRSYHNEVDSVDE